MRHAMRSLDNFQHHKGAVFFNLANLLCIFGHQTIWATGDNFRLLLSWLPHVSSNIKRRRYHAQGKSEIGT